MEEFLKNIYLWLRHKTHAIPTPAQWPRPGLSQTGAGTGVTSSPVVSSDIIGCVVTSGASWTQTEQCCRLSSTRSRDSRTKLCSVMSSGWWSWFFVFASSMSSAWLSSWCSIETLIMDCCGHLGTFLVIILFSLDIFTDVATGVELFLNDHPFCEYLYHFYVLSLSLKKYVFLRGAHARNALFFSWLG